MAEPIRILVIHGPNLNLLGTREPEVYGSTTLEEINSDLSAEAKTWNAEVEFFQSNHEGALIDRIQEAGSWADGIVINSIDGSSDSVTRDALLATALPVVEVHLTNLFAREDFRRHSYVSGIAVGVISGFGPSSYRLGLQALLDHLDS